MTSPPHKGTGIMKNVSIGKVIGTIGILFLVIVVLGFVSVRIFFPPSKIKALVVEQVGKKLDREVKVDKAGITLFPTLGVSLGGVEISNTTRSGFSDESFVVLDKFLVRISFMSLVKREPVIQKIILKKPSIVLEIDKNGAFNFDDLAVMQKDSTAETGKKEKKEGLPVLPVPVSLKTFVIEDGRFVYRNAKTKQDIIINDIDDRIDFSIDKALTDVKTSGELSLADMSVKTPELSKPLSNFTVTFNHNIAGDLTKGNVTVNELRFSLQKIFLSMKGTVEEMNTAPKLDLQMVSDPITIEDVLREVPVELVPVVAKLKAKGELTLGVNLKGVLEKGKPFPVSGNVGISDGSIQYQGLPKSINRINLKCEFTENSLNLSALKMFFGDNPIALQAKVDNFKKPQVNARLKTDLNLDDMKDFMKLPDGASVGGRVTADIIVKGEPDPADLRKCDIKGGVKLKGVKVMWPPLQKPATINGDVSLSNVAVGEKMSVVIGRSNLTMSTTVRNYLSMVFPDSTKKLPRPNVNFTLASTMLDIDEILPPGKEEGAGKEAAEKTEKGGPLIAPLPGVDAKGTIKARSVMYKKIPMKQVTIDISVIDDIAKIIFNSRFAGGSISEKLHANLKNTSNVRFSNDLSIKTISVADLLSIFGVFIKPTTPLNRELKNLPKSLSGNLSFSSQFSGNGGTTDELLDNLAGNLDARMTNGSIAHSLLLKRLAGVVEKFLSIKDITFKNLSAGMHVENSMVQIEKMAMASNAGDWDIGGAVGFDAALNLTVSNRLTKRASASVLKLQGSGKNLLKGLAQGTKYSGLASNMVDNVGIPTDKQGRITLKMGLNGPISDPKAKFIGFGEGSGGTSQKPRQSVKKQVTKKVKAAIDQKKQEAQRRLAEQRKKAEAVARHKTQQQRKVVEQKKQEVQKKTKVIEKDLKKNAKNRLKKLF